MVAALVLVRECEPTRSLEDKQTALSLASQVPGDGAEKQKTIDFLPRVIDWIGQDADSGAKRNALALALQLPSDPASATAVTALVQSLISSLFAGEAA
jgi:hypothetical protein